MAAETGLQVRGTFLNPGRIAGDDFEIIRINADEPFDLILCCVVAPLRAGENGQDAKPGEKYRFKPFHRNHPDWAAFLFAYTT